MVRETEVKAATFCVVAFVLGLCCALMLGCKTSAKVEGGAEIIELKPLELQELTFLCMITVGFVSAVPLLKK